MCTLWEAMYRTNATEPSLCRVTSLATEGAIATTTFLILHLYIYIYIHDGNVLFNLVQTPHVNLLRGFILNKIGIVLTKSIWYLINVFLYHLNLLWQLFTIRIYDYYHLFYRLFSWKIKYKSRTVLIEFPE